MPKYDTLPLEFSLHFRKLRDSKEKKKVLGEPLSIAEIRRRATILSEPNEPANVDKLRFKRGLSTKMVNSKNGKFLVIQRIRASNMQAFYKAFPHLEGTAPAWFDKNFSVAKAVDELMGLHFLTLVVSLDLCPPSKRRKLA